MAWVETPLQVGDARKRSSSASILESKFASIEEEAHQCSHPLKFGEGHERLRAPVRNRRKRAFRKGPTSKCARCRLCMRNRPLD